jgi:stage V sporulation protein SpoVS
LREREVAELKVSGRSETARVAKAIYAVIMKGKDARLLAIGQPALATAAKAVASASQILGAENLLVSVTWTELEVPERGKVTAVAFHVGRP